MHLGGAHRLALMEWVPELSLAVVASQGLRARLIHLHRNAAGAYTLVPGAFIPANNEATPALMLLGLSVRRLRSEISPALDVWLVHLMCVWLRSRYTAHRTRQLSGRDVVRAGAAAASIRDRLGRRSGGRVELVCKCTVATRGTREESCDEIGFLSTWPSNHPPHIIVLCNVQEQVR